jgi:hypothetical protein
LYNPNLWNFFTGADPTHGTVNYLDYNDALNDGLLSYQTLGTNYYNTYIGSSAGSAYGTRNSVRLSSKTTWNQGLFVMEFSHMPTGCGTWPAWWMVNSGNSWPAGGEIDIVEGVNNAVQNSVTLHTNNVCNMDQESGQGYGNLFTGGWVTGSNGGPATDCWIDDPNQYANQGCSIYANNVNSFGSGFNAGGGGTYAMELTSSFIRVFFFPKSAGHVWESNPNPDTWGTPQAQFNFGSNCAASTFYNLELVLDLTFCGDWAGGVFSQTCGSLACQDYIAQNQGTLNANAYWDINSITVYEV